jgi:DNA repair exonuclease SbcCD ATPase subunit
MKTPREFRKFLDTKRGEELMLIKLVSTTESRMKENKRELRKHEEARIVLAQVAQDTQNQLSYRIGDITTLALDSVFPNPYSLSMEFVTRRNKTECDLFFIRNGNICDPIAGSGGGAVDIAALALRVASWAVRRPRNNNVLLLDEPLSHLSANLRPQASQMIRTLSQNIKLQIIMVSHAEELIEAADVLFETTLQNGVSIVHTETPML